MGIESKPLREKEVSQFIVETELKKDLRSTIASSIIQGGFEILDIHSIKMSLEDVFTQITTQEEERNQ